MSLRLEEMRRKNQERLNQLHSRISKNSSYCYNQPQNEIEQRKEPIQENKPSYLNNIPLMNRNPPYYASYSNNIEKEKNPSQLDYNFMSKPVIEQNLGLSSNKNDPFNLNTGLYANQNVNYYNPSPSSYAFNSSYGGSMGYSQPKISNESSQLIKPNEGSLFFSSNGNIQKIENLSDNQILNFSQREFNQALDSVNKKYDIQRKDIENDMNSKKSQIQQETDKNTSNLEDENRNKKQALEKEKLDFMKYYENKYNEIKAEYQKKICDIQDKLKSLTDQYQNEYSDKMKNIKSAQDIETNEINSLCDKIIAKRKEIQNKMLEDEYDRKSKLQDKRHWEEMERINKEREENLIRHQKTMEQLQEENQKLLAQIENENNTRIKLLEEEAKNKELFDKKLKEDLQNMREKFQKAYYENEYMNKRELEKIKNKFEAKMKEIDEKTKKEISRIQNERNAKIEKMNKEHDKAMKELKNASKEKLEQLEQIYQLRRIEIESQYSSLIGIIYLSSNDSMESEYMVLRDNHIY